MVFHNISSCQKGQKTTKFNRLWFSLSTPQCLDQIKWNFNDATRETNGTSPYDFEGGWAVWYLRVLDENHLRTASQKFAMHLQIPICNNHSLNCATGEGHRLRGKEWICYTAASDVGFRIRLLWISVSSEWNQVWKRCTGRAKDAVLKVLEHPCFLHQSGIIKIISG